MSSVTKKEQKVETPERSETSTEGSEEVVEAPKIFRSPQKKVHKRPKPSCPKCEFESPCQGCYRGYCTRCCKRETEGFCQFHKQVDPIFLDWVESAKQRQEVRRGFKKVRTAAQERSHEAFFENFGDTAVLFSMHDFATSKALSDWKQPSHSKTSSRGWTEADKAVVLRRGIPCRKKSFAAFLSTFNLDS